MTQLTSWTQFLEYQIEEKPLQFRHGMRHPFKTGGYCPVHSHPEFEIVYHPIGEGITSVNGVPLHWGQ